MLSIFPGISSATSVADDSGPPIALSPTLNLESSSKSAWRRASQLPPLVGQAVLFLRRRVDAGRRSGGSPRRASFTFRGRARQAIVFRR
jgi:hypothetical protein